MISHIESKNAKRLYYPAAHRVGGVPQVVECIGIARIKNWGWPKMDE